MSFKWDYKWFLIGIGIQDLLFIFAEISGEIPSPMWVALTLPLWLGVLWNLLDYAVFDGSKKE